MFYNNIKCHISENTNKIKTKSDSMCKRKESSLTNLWVNIHKLNLIVIVCVHTVILGLLSPILIEYHIN